MNLPRFCVQRPVFTTMIASIVVILGGISVSRLAMDLMPDISYPTLSVMTIYDHASPVEVEELITRPIEEAMGAVPGVEDITSSSWEGVSTVTVNFTWGTNLDVAAGDVRDRLDRVIPRLPDNAARPILRKFDPAAFPILILGASSSLDPIHMRRLLDDDITHRIERIPGVAALDITGGHQREIHVDIDPDRLRVLDISFEQLIQRLRTANVTMPAGFVEEGPYQVTLRVPGEFRGLDELARTTVARRGGVAIRLRDVAEVKDRWRRVTRIVRMDGEPGVRLAVSRQSERNTVEVAQRVLEEVDRINAEMPHIRLTPIVDTSEFIQRSVANVRSAALLGGLFTLVVLLLFLRSIRSTAIIAAVIPLSIIATFVLIYFGGFTLNLMTLGGLALGVGMLVDNSIVVLENTYRKLEQGEAAATSAIEGAGQVSAALVASTLTTLAVFLPLIFVRGMAGVMFRQLAFVVSFALLSSLLAALTLIPMLAARFLQPLVAKVHADQPADLDPHAARRRTRMESTYQRLLHWALNHRLQVVIVAILVLAGSLALIPLVGTELMPATDEGEVRVNVEMDVGLRLAETDRIFTQIETLVRREAPEIRHMVTSVGGSPRPDRPGASHLGMLRISLVPLGERARSTAAVAAALRRVLASIPGATVRVRAAQGMPMLRRVTGGEEQLEVEIRGHDLDTADDLARQVLRVVESVPGITDARISRDIGTPERLIRVDRDKAEILGVSIVQVAQLLQTAMTGTRAGLYREAGEEIDIRVQIAEAEHRPLRELLDLGVLTPDGVTVALHNIVHDELSTGPIAIDRLNQERIVRVHGNIANRDMGSIIADVRQALTRIPVPQGFSVGIGGAYEEQQEAFRELAVGLLLALVLVYMVMACLYESLRDPFIVMFSVPLTVTGVVLMFFLTGTTFNVQSFIGCIMLGGIVVNNAILLVDTVNDLRRHGGLDIRQAVEEAGRRRLRPILMTALTTIFGLLPLALGLGEGGEMQAPLARAVIGGLLGSTLVTLIFVPVMYTVFERNNAAILTSCATFLLLAGCATSSPAQRSGMQASSPPPSPTLAATEIDADPGSDPEEDASGPLTLDLEEAVLMALDNNRELRIQRLEPTRLREQEDVHRGVFYPVSSVEIAERRSRTEKPDQPEELVDAEATRLAGAIALTSPFGTRWGVELGAERKQREDQERYTARIEAHARQPLLRDAGRAVNRVNVEQARLDTRLSEYELRAMAEALVARVERTYWAYSLALQRQTMLEEAVRLAERQLDEIRQRIRLGDLPPTEEAAAAAEVAVRREALIEATSKVEIARVRLLRLIHPVRLRLPETSINLSDQPQLPETELKPLAFHLTAALRYRPDINQARTRAERGQLELIRTANGVLPRLDLFLHLGRTGYADSFSKAAGDLDGEAFEATAGVRLEWPLPDREAGARHRHAVWRQEQIEESLRNLEDLAREDVHIAHAGVRRAGEQVQARAATRALQEETLRVEAAKFAAGESTALMVAHAQRELLGARIGEAEATIEHLQALTELYRQDGTLLHRRGISAPGQGSSNDD